MECWSNGVMEYWAKIRTPILQHLLQGPTDNGERKTVNKKEAKGLWRSWIWVIITFEASKPQ